MKFGHAIEGDVSAIVRQQHDGLASDLREDADGAGLALKGTLRGQTSSAGLGTRLGQAWRSRTYPAPTVKTLSPAALVWSNAPTIHRAYEEGSLIVPTGGRRSLAIPSDLVPRKAGKRRLTPAEVEARFGRKLRPVRLRNGRTLLLLDGVVAGRAGGLRRASAGRLRQGRPEKSVVMFTLVPQVKVQKRLDIAAAAAEAQADLAGRVAARAGAL